MDINFIEIKEATNIVPLKLENKEQYYLDLMNIEQSWTGRMDAMFSNEFFREAVQLVINAIVLFEKGYFDCALYSLRQSLEISTTVVYFVDDSEINRDQELMKWKTQKRFPMYNQMISELQKRNAVFSDIRDKMSLYFEEIEKTKVRLNKYVHKQGFDKFYVTRNGPSIKDREKYQIKLISDFKTFLIRSMGAIAIYRLAIDPLPVLLMDINIFNRTGQFMTESYSEDFIEKYIGVEHIENYKTTNLYQDFYNTFIAYEEMLPSVLEVVKFEFIDRTKIDEIISQKHLLGPNDLVAVELISYSEKIAKVYCPGGYPWYLTNVDSKRKITGWSSNGFKVFEGLKENYNINYDEAFLSRIKFWDEDYYIEHNEKFSEAEIAELNSLSLRYTNLEPK